jgi:hypothetical protein
MSVRRLGFVSRVKFPVSETERVCDEICAMLRKDDRSICILEKEKWYLNYFVGRLNASAKKLEMEYIPHTHAGNTFFKKAHEGTPRKPATTLGESILHRWYRDMHDD